MSSPSDQIRSFPTKDEPWLTVLIRGCAVLSFASLVLAGSVWFVNLKWTTVAYSALAVSILFAAIALLAEVSRLQLKNQRLDRVRSKAELQQRKIHKLRLGIRALWISSGIFVVAGAVSIIFYGGLLGYLPYSHSAVFAIIAWSNHRQLRFEMIDNARQREWIKATNRAKIRNQVYWIALFALPVAPALWMLAWFSTLPIPLPITGFEGAILWVMLGGAGAMLIDFGYKEMIEPPPLDCFSCDHQYDATAKPIRCTKCGIEPGEYLRKWTHSTRPKRMFQLASAYIVIAGLGVFASASPTAKTLLLAKRPARMLIAEFGAPHHWFDDQTSWIELMMRMPLAPADRQRLVDRVVALTVTNDPPLSIFVTGLEQWTASALPKTTTYKESIDDLLTYIDNTWSPLSYNNHALLAVAKIVYLIDLADLPASERNRAVRLAFAMANGKPNPLTSLARIREWLYRAYLDHSLNNEEDQRALNVVRSSDVLRLMALGHLRPTTDEQRRRLAELQQAVPD